MKAKPTWSYTQAVTASITALKEEIFLPLLYVVLYKLLSVSHSVHVGGKCSPLMFTFNDKFALI